MLVQEPVSLNFEAIIKKFAPMLIGMQGKIYVQPNIPEKKLTTAIKSFGGEINKMNIIALHDGIAFGKGTDGFIITKAGFYYKELIGKPFILEFNRLRAVELREIPVKRKNSDKVKHTIHMTTDEGEVSFPVNEFYIDGRQFYLFLKEVVKLAESNLVDETDKIMILEDMPDEVKVNYVNAIVKFITEEFGDIDGKSLSEIQTLMAQLDFDVTLRNEVRSFIARPNAKMEELLIDMMLHIPRGSETALKISLIKDMVRVHRAKELTTAATQIKTIQQLGARYAIENAQIEVIEQGIINDEKIMRGEVKDNQIIKNAKDLSAKAAAVGMPIAAIYMSGSVVGLSAAGLTSGLAALGLGGVLGLSSMVTGIGVVVLGGIGVYKGVQWLTGGNERSKTQKREFFIQEIIKNNQKTINNLAEDVNYYAEKVVEVALEQDINKERLNKLGKELSVFTQALKRLQKKGVDLQTVLEKED